MGFWDQVQSGAIGTAIGGAIGGGVGSLLGGGYGAIRGTSFDPTRQTPQYSNPEYEKLMIERERAKEEQKRLSAALEERITAARGEEERLKNMLPGQREAYERALDAQLGRGLEEAGYRGGEQRRGIGALAAERGLGRSTFAQRGIEEQLLGEQQEKAGLRYGTEQQKTQARLVEQEQLKGIERRRQALEAKRDVIKYESAQGRELAAEIQAAEDAFKSEAARIGLASQRQEQYTGLIGGIFGQGARLFTARL